MSAIPISLLTYLKKFSEPHWKIEAANLENIVNVIVIPSIAELDSLPALLTSLNKNNPEYLKTTLVLFVVNNSVVCSDEVRENNLLTINYLREIIFNNSGHANLRIGLVDASSDGNELQQKFAGVGFARKIGMDLSLNIFNYDSPKKKILICLDADCTISENYLEVISYEFNQKNLMAASINFEHSIEGYNDTTEAIICYEIFLRYYVMGLKIASSPYAFETVGSSMACDFESYIKIGGMNKLKAAEDFYFLEKLSKVTKISTIKNAFVYPSGRRSWRVPFGTGQRVGRFLEKVKDEYLLYDINSFIILKKWLSVYSNNCDSKTYLHESEKINKELKDFLLAQDFEKALNNILANAKTDSQLAKQKRNWFDGFKTLKLIHHLRDNGYPQMKMFDALDELFDYFNVSKPARNSKDNVPDLEIQKEYLYLLRKLESELD